METEGQAPTIAIGCTERLEPVPEPEMCDVVLRLGPAGGIRRVLVQSPLAVPAAAR